MDDVSRIDLYDMRTFFHLKVMRVRWELIMMFKRYLQVTKQASIMGTPHLCCGGFFSKASRGEDWLDSYASDGDWLSVVLLLAVCSLTTLSDRDFIDAKMQAYT